MVHISIVSDNEKAIIELLYGRLRFVCRFVSSDDIDDETCAQMTIGNENRRQNLKTKTETADFLKTIGLFTLCFRRSPRTK